MDFHMMHVNYRDCYTKIIVIFLKFLNFKHYLTEDIRFNFYFFKHTIY